MEASVTRSRPLLESVGADLRYAIRTLRRSASFTGVAVATLSSALAVTLA